MPLKHGEDDGFSQDRRKVLDAAVARAPFDGWNTQLLRLAAAEIGYDRHRVRALFPDGVRDALRYWSHIHDAAMVDAMSGPDFAGLKIREKVAFAVLARIDAMRENKESARRAAATLALPHNTVLGGQLVWRTADAIWLGLGDKSTDINWYTKRATLTGVWTSTLARWFADDSDDESATRSFLDARIENVMQFEKAKASFSKLGLDPKAPIEFFARLRYPAGR